MAAGIEKPWRKRVSHPAFTESVGVPKIEVTETEPTRNVIGQNMGGHHKSGEGLAVFSICFQEKLAFPRNVDSSLCWQRFCKFALKQPALYRLLLGPVLSGMLWNHKRGFRGHQISGGAWWFAPWAQYTLTMPNFFNDILIYPTSLPPWLESSPSGLLPNVFP